MMISPESYIKLLEEKSYEELLIEREMLLSSIKEFEKCGGTENAEIISPSPDTRYQCDLLYLSKLCELIVEKYRKKVEVKNLEVM